MRKVSVDKSAQVTYNSAYYHIIMVKCKRQYSTKENKGIYSAQPLAPRCKRRKTKAGMPSHRQFGMRGAHCLWLRNCSGTEQL
ncbi:MAG: hypothetical protein IKQ96_00510, partial [Lachnospiraceae bacterium]|nr:hypothetical protein [Lachnospiraceae bacterium]